ncbi:hypothetical protein [Sinimarinibacterium sp. NLF-5-8]|uniref:hypothetical protein n=1 Tax=Sinimarinibacterium sp. NLF-5-8 TaxID=2698684 RepID=UPI00137C3C80|nr:hypothetical protein [Sinimarinibacterium sp. NLF-5-8]QHS10832.1 hypothetical protein GT972_12230 [Sinimarinibacterium sp. NLF-5-8]
MTAQGQWYRQPTVWLGLLLLLASIAGCAWLIVAAQQYPDPELELSGGKLLKMPIDSAPAQSTPPSP